jgi:hypothetical protein
MFISASSDSGVEGVLNMLWQKYENAIDKVSNLACWFATNLFFGYFL